MSMETRKENLSRSYDSTVINRTPDKKLNLIIKTKLLNILSRDDVFVDTKSKAGINRYFIKTANNTLFSFIENYASGQYSILVEDITVAQTYWFKGDNYTNQEQQDIFDVLSSIYNKLATPRFITPLTQQEIQAIQILKSRIK